MEVGLCSQVTSNKTRGKGLGLHQGRFGLYIFHGQGCQVMAQTALGSDEVLNPGGILKPCICVIWDMSSGGLGSAGGMAGLSDLGGLFQPQ